MSYGEVLFTQPMPHWQGYERRIRRLSGPRLQPYVVEMFPKYRPSDGAIPVFWTDSLASAFERCGLPVKTEVLKVRR